MRSRINSLYYFLLEEVGVRLELFLFGCGRFKKLLDFLYFKIIELEVMEVWF